MLRCGILESKGCTGRTRRRARCSCRGECEGGGSSQIWAGETAWISVKCVVSKKEQ